MHRVAPLADAVPWELMHARLLDGLYADVAASIGIEGDAIDAYARTVFGGTSDASSVGDESASPDPRRKRKGNEPQHLRLESSIAEPETVQRELVKHETIDRNVDVAAPMQPSDPANILVVLKKAETEGAITADERRVAKGILMGGENEKIRAWLLADDGDLSDLADTIKNAVATFQGSAAV